MKPMSKKACSIVWNGLKDGPAYEGKSPELKKMTKEFLASHGQMKDPEEFGQAMRDFAEDKGYEVEDNVYLDGRLNESLSEADEKAFVKALKAGKVKFSYKKVDGSTRKAVGTLKPELIKHGATEKKIEDGKKKRFVPPTVLVYWDVEADAFRSFKMENFIEFEEA